MTNEELDKACEWMRTYFPDELDGKGFEFVSRDTIIEDFRKAMNPYIDTETSKRLSEEVTRGIVEQISPEYDAEYLQSKIDAHTKYMQEHGITSEQQLATLDEMRGQDCNQSKARQYSESRILAIPADVNEDGEVFYLNSDLGTADDEHNGLSGEIELAYDNGYGQALLDTELTWQDMAKIWRIGMYIADYNSYHNIPIENEAFFKEILNQYINDTHETSH